MADKDELAWNFYYDDTLRDQNAQTALDNTQREKPSRSAREWFDDVFSNAVDTLAAGGDGRQVLGAAIQAGAGTDRYMAQKRAIVTQSEMNDLKLRRAQRTEQKEIEDREALRADEIAARKAKLQLATQTSQSQLRRLQEGENAAAAEDRVRLHAAWNKLNAEDLRQSAQNTQRFLEEHPQFTQLAPEYQKNIIESKEFKRFAQANYLGRVLTRGLKNPQEMERARYAIEQMGGEFVERDGKTFVRVGDKEMEFNEPNCAKLYTEVRSQLDKRIAEELALSPSEIKGDAMMQIVAPRAHNLKEFFGDDLGAAKQFVTNAMQKSLTRDQRIIMGARQALDGLIKAPNDVAAQQAAQIFITPGPNGKTLLEEIGYEYDGSDPAAPKVIKRGPNGQVSESWALPQFADKLKELDTGTKQLDETIERQKQIITEARKLELAKKEYQAGLRDRPKNDRKEKKKVGEGEDEGGDDNTPKLTNDQVNSQVALFAKLYGKEEFVKRVPYEKRAEVAEKLARLHSNAMTVCPNAVVIDPHTRAPAVDLGAITFDQAQKMADFEDKFEEGLSIEERAWYGLGAKTEENKKGYWYRILKLKETEKDWIQAKGVGREHLLEHKSAFQKYTERRKGMVSRVNDLVKLGIIDEKTGNGYLRSLGIDPKTGDDLTPNGVPQSYEKWSEEFTRRANDRERGAQNAKRQEKRERQFRDQDRFMRDSLGDVDAPGR